MGNLGRRYRSGNYMLVLSNAILFVTIANKRLNVSSVTRVLSLEISQTYGLWDASRLFQTVFPMRQTSSGSLRRFSEEILPIALFENDIAKKSPIHLHASTLVQKHR